VVPTIHIVLATTLLLLPWSVFELLVSIAVAAVLVVVLSLILIIGKYFLASLKTRQRLWRPIGGFALFLTCILFFLNMSGSRDDLDSLDNTVNCAALPYSSLGVRAFSQDDLAGRLLFLFGLAWLGHWVGLGLFVVHVSNC
jgi:hypothetical protein